MLSAYPYPLVGFFLHSIAWTLWVQSPKTPKQQPSACICKKIHHHITHYTPCENDYHHYYFLSVLGLWNPLAIEWKLSRSSTHHTRWHKDSSTADPKAGLRRAASSWFLLLSSWRQKEGEKKKTLYCTCFSFSILSYFWEGTCRNMFLIGWKYDTNGRRTTKEISFHCFTVLQMFAPRHLFHLSF